MYKNRILIDACQVNYDPRGMGLYTKDIINAINNEKLWILTNNKFLLENHNKKNATHKIIYIPLPHTVIEQFIIPILIKFYSINLYVTAGDTSSILGSYICNTILILHDIYFTKSFKMQNTSFKRILGKFYRKFTIKMTVAKSIKIITVSKFTAKEITEFYNININKVYVIGNKLRYSIEDIKKNNNDVLLVTGSDKQKNVYWAISSLKEAKIWDKISKVKIVGINNYEEVGIDKDDKISYLGYINNSDLEEVYKTSKILLIPSIHESFGVPIIEALSKSCSVCASNTGAFNEVGGKLTNFFNLEDKEMFIDTIKKSLDETHNIKKIISHLKQYSELSFNSKIKNIFL